MRNTDHISELIDMSFNEMLFPVRKVIIKGFGERYISTESFEHALMVDDVFVSDEAMEIDDKIFFYVEDKIINFDDKKLAKYVEGNVV